MGVIQADKAAEALVKAKRKRLRTMHAKEATQCPHCCWCRVISEQQGKLLADDTGRIVCEQCKGTFLLTEDWSIPERDKRAGVAIYAIGPNGRRYLCERGHYCVEWFLDKISEFGSMGTCGTGTPLLVCHAANLKSQRYAYWVAEALQWRNDKRRLYALATVEVTK